MATELRIEDVVTFPGLPWRASTSLLFLLEAQKRLVRVRGVGPYFSDGLDLGPFGSFTIKLAKIASAFLRASYVRHATSLHLRPPAIAFATCTTFASKCGIMHKVFAHHVLSPDDRTNRNGDFGETGH